MNRYEKSKEAAAQWRAARQLYPVYAALVRQFELGIPPSRDLENPADRSEPEVLERVWKWFDDVDVRLQVFQLRQLMQFSALATEQNLHLLIDRHLGKPSHSEADRDKVDFLLVQYFAHCVSPDLSEHNTEFSGVAEVLMPVLGDVAGPAPEALKPLEQALEVLRWCRTLSDVLENGVLEHGRRIKSAIGEKYFEPAALVEFVRFNVVLRRAFFRLLQTDLHSVRRTLDELEKKGHSIVDCAQAGLSSEESLAALRQKCLEWKKPFQASYSAGPLPFAEIVAVRAALEHALTQPPLEPKPEAVEAVPEVLMEEEPSEEVLAAPEAVLVAEPMPQVIPAAESVSEPDVLELEPIVAESVIETQIPTPVPQVIEETPQMPASSPVAAKAPIAVKTIEPPQPSPIIKPASIPTPAVVARQPVAAQPAAPAKPAAPPPAPTAAPQVADVQSCLESIAEQLFASAGKAAAAATTVIVGSAKVVLSSWEVEAFVRGGDEVCDTLQRAVAARAVLSEAVDSRKRGGDSDGLPSSIVLAQTEAASAQLQIDAAKKARNLDAAVNLAATAKRLLALITEAQSLASLPALEMSR
ncbi:MAG: hypothetical protein ACRD24_01020 [Terriglobales bacterium]